MKHFFIEGWIDTVIGLGQTTNAIIALKRSRVVVIKFST